MRWDVLSGLVLTGLVLAALALNSAVAPSAPSRAEDQRSLDDQACLQAASDPERHDLGCPDDPPRRAAAESFGD